MAAFEVAIGKTLEHEGGHVNHMLDPGGETNFGISKRSYPNEDIPRMTRERAFEIYQRDFWNPLYDQIADQEIADEAFDFGVNVGRKNAVKTLQESLRYFVAGPVLADGEFGAKTLEMVNSTQGKALLREFRARQAYYYADLVIRQPDTNEAAKKTFLLGWLRRVMA